MAEVIPTEADMGAAGAVVHEYGPQLGHYPDLVFSIAQAIATARMEERERCALD